MRKLGSQGWSVALAAMLAAAAPSAASADVEAFYKGGTIRIIVGYGPGGGFDITARLVARKMGDYIPGKPSVIVENMPGGGGMRVANYLFSVAPKDGTALGVFSSDVAMEPLLGNKLAKFSADQFEWIGSMTTDINSCALWRDGAHGVRTFQDMLTSKKEIVFGSSGPQSNTSKYPLFFKNVLGAPIKIVTGFGGTNEGVLAMKRGEIDGMCGIQETSVMGAFLSDFESGDLNVIIQLGTGQRSDLFKNATTIDEAVQGKGEETRAIADVVFGPAAISRPLAAPPGVPADRVAALRKAMIDVTSDPQLVEMSAKTGLKWKPMPGQDVQAKLKSYYGVPRAILEKADAVTRE